MSKRCPSYRKFHIGNCGTSQVCFHSKQTGYVKRFYPMLSSAGSVGQSSGQPRTPIQGFGKLAVRLSVFSKSVVGSSSGT